MLTEISFISSWIVQGSRLKRQCSEGVHMLFKAGTMIAQLLFAFCNLQKVFYWIEAMNEQTEKKLVL